MRLAKKQKDWNQARGKNLHVVKKKKICAKEIIRNIISDHAT